MGGLSGLVAALLVVPALAITIARLLPGDSLTWVILRSATPLAILPYAAAAAVLVVTTRGMHAGARSAAVTALVAVVSLLCLHLWWVVRPTLDDAPGSPTGESFTVMTANLHIGEADPEAVLSAVARHDVDVLVLVEITPRALADLDRAGLDLRLAHRAGTATEGRDGLMVFARSPVRSVGEIPTISPGHDVEMDTPSGTVRILAAHPTAPNNGVAQWSGDLDAVVSSARTSQGPTVVAGDFNATVDHPQLLALMAADYRDASADAGIGWRPTWPSHGDVQIAGMGLPSLFALDHVFLRGPLAATRAETTIISGTDHRALVD